MTFVLVVVVMWLILSTGSIHGFRRSYYRGPSMAGLMVVWFICLGIGLLFLGPSFGYYGSLW